jgi:hypothetical protein
MRKLLLAATAMIGATAGMANAQVVPPAVVVVPPPSPAATLPDRVPQPGTAVVLASVPASSSAVRRAVPRLAKSRLSVKHAAYSWGHNPTVRRTCPV